MFNRKTPAVVLLSSQTFLVLGASPDAKVINFECSICFGLAVVKSPHTKFHRTVPQGMLRPKFLHGEISIEGIAFDPV